MVSLLKKAAEEVIEWTVGYVASGEHSKNLAKLGAHACDAAIMYN